MSTLPVRKTAWRGIIFPFTHFIPLARRLGLTVAILLCSLPLQLFILPTMVADGTTSFLTMTLINVALFPLYMVLYLNFLVGPIQVAIGAPERRKLFGLGKTELLVFAFFLLVMLGFLVAYMPVMVAGLGLGALVPDAAMGITVILLLPVLMGVVVWALFRLYPIFGLIAEEKRLGIKQAWQMSKGKWWRIFGVFFLVTLFYALLTLPPYIFLMKQLVPQMFEIFRAGASPEMQMVALAELQASLWPLTLAQWIIALFSMAAHGGALGFIYTALKEQDAAPSAA